MAVIFKINIYLCDTESEHLFIIHYINKKYLRHGYKTYVISWDSRNVFEVTVSLP